MADSREALDSLFCSALELPSGEREAYLARVCRDEPNLRRLVEDLLREEERAGSFMAGPLLRLAVPEEEAAGETVDPAGIVGVKASSRFQPTQMIAERFVVVRFIARGGMGEVYEVQDTLLHDAHVALKILRPEIAASAASSHRFEQEVLLARKVVHPNLCPIYEIFRSAQPPPFLFLTMKLFGGETLEACLRNSKGMTHAEAEQVARELIAGVAAIHIAGVIHRDLKPNNVMLERSGERLCVSIMDFGLARLYDSELTQFGTGIIAGTPGYLAPELLNGHPPSQATDIFALGVMLHQVLTGERPAQAPHGGSQRARPSLNGASAPPLLIAAVRDFLSDSPEKRCIAFERVAVNLTLPIAAVPTTRMSRRRFAISSGAFACALAGGAVWQRERIYDLVHPLPRKRFVALLTWPPPADDRLRPMLMGLIDAMAEDLSRAEAYDHDFFAASEKTVTDVKTPAQLNEVRESLGANLVLATSGHTDGSDVHIGLHVMDPVSGETLRSKEIRARFDQVLSLPERAVQAAAELLEVAHYQQDDPRSNVGTNNPAALAAFQQGQLLRKQENDTGLGAAIAKYKEALEWDPHYVEAQAALGWAYIRSYALHGESAALALARENCEAAAKLQPTFVDAHLGQAWLLETTGDHAAAARELAKALSLDPSNVHTLVYQAKFYADNGQYSKAEEAYRRALKLRPNFWLLHNEFGFFLDNVGRYREALDEFKTASMAAPRNALALTNIAVVSLQIGNLDEAIAGAQKSFAIYASDLASATLAEAYRIQKRMADALRFSQKAVELNPASSANWIELGDCNLTASEPTAAMRSYRRALSTEEEELRNDPKFGAGWMLLAFCRAITGDVAGAISAMSESETSHGDDITSQLLKVRTLEVLGRRDEALVLAATCVRRGATRFQLDTMPNLQILRNDPRYPQLFGAGPAATPEVTYSFTKGREHPVFGLRKHLKQGGNMTKRIVGSLLSLTLLSLLTGCTHKSNSSYVFENSDGNLVAGPGEEQHRKLTWRSADPKITQFWIKFNPANSCEGADDGVIASVSGKITCVVNTGENGPVVKYQIYKQDPRREKPSIPPPEMNVYIGPRSCGGC